MTKRPLALLPAALLALSLSGCGSDAGGEGASDEPAASASASESASESPGAEESEQAGESEAADDDYVALAQALSSVPPPQNGAFKSADEVNRAADFPEGVSVAEFDEKAQRICIEDTTTDVAITVDAKNQGAIGLVEGMCADGEEVAGVEPRGAGEVKVSGDKDVAAPLVEFATGG